MRYGAGWSGLGALNVTLGENGFVVNGRGNSYLSVSACSGGRTTYLKNGPGGNERGGKRKRCDCGGTNRGVQ